MLKELNQAYKVLKDPRLRSAYHLTFRGESMPPVARANRPASAPKEPERQPSLDIGVLSSGYARYSDLPQESRERLSKRTKRVTRKQYITSFKGVGWNCFFLFICSGWFVFMFSLAQNGRWTSEGKSWIFGASIVVSLFLGVNLKWIASWYKSPLRCYFIVSPLYFIKTHLNQVWFWPIWELKDLSATHNYKNGFFTGTDVRFVFDTGPERLSFSKHDAYDQVVKAAREFDAKVRIAKEKGQREYFLVEDDFRGWTPVVRSEPKRGPSLATTITLGSSFGLAVLLTLIAIEVNASAFPYKPSPQSASAKPAASSRVTDSSPVRSAFTEPELTFPVSGEVWWYTTQRGVAPLQIRSSLGDNYLVKLDDVITGEPVLTVFIRGGKTEEVEVPLGTYEVKYASGNRWYGSTYLFGPDTQYSKAEQNFTFTSNGSQYSGYTYSGYTITLYKVRDGNLRTRMISADEF